METHLESGALVSVLEEFTREDLWIYIAYLQRKHNSAALKALVDFLITRLKD